MNPAAKESFPSPEVRVVEASAGSGKTYALAKRYVQLILHLTRARGAPPVHTILAITFTNKAAFEMKERIITLLKQLALGVMNDAERDGIIGPITMTPARAREAAAQVMDTILRHYNFFQVQTIDKFINGLLVTSAFRIGLTADFRIKTRSREYLAAALDALIDEASSRPAVRKAFDDFLVSMLLVESRSAWLPRDVILDTVEQLFGEHNTYARDFVRGGVRPEDILKIKTGVLGLVGDLVERMPRGAHATFEKSMRKFVADHRKGFRFAAGLSSYFDAGKPIQPKKGMVLEAWHEDQWALIQKALASAARAEVEHLYDPYLEIFARVREKLDAACRRDDIVFLASLNAMAKAVHEQGLSPDELYYRLAVRFEHYLFDEFQDTSLLQWENLRMLPEDAIARGGSLFYVGDKKQAIYSFRGGETRLFDDIRAQYAEGYHLRSEPLTISRRSHERIVAFNNEIFSIANLAALMRAGEGDDKPLLPVRPQDIAELQRVYGGARQEALASRPGGCVRVERLDGDGKDEVYAAARPRVMARLRELKSRFAWREIAILVRKNDEVERVTRWLLEEGIPSSSERTLNIREHPLVGEVAAFLRFLASPADNAAFGEFIQGRIFAAASGMFQDDLRDALLDWRQMKKGPLYEQFRAAFPSWWQRLLEPFFNAAGMYPLYETVASFYRVTGALEHFPDDQGFLMHFLGLIGKNEEECPDAASFLAYYDDLEGESLYVDVVASDAVQVMTVHKAKGLGFSAVIVPFLSISLTRSRSGQRKALMYTLCPEEDGLKLYHFNEHHTRHCALAQELAVEEKMGLFFAELNNVYVALTRAACEMHLFIPPRAGSGVNLALYLVPERLYAAGDPAPAYPNIAAEPAGAPRELLPPACRDWMAFLKDEFMDESTLTSRRHRERGKAFHAALAGDSSGLTPEMRQELELFLADARIRPFVEAPGAQVLVEQEFVDRAGCSRRMDRVLVFEREVWVIDFKTSRADEAAGVAQVREYIGILREVYPRREVKGFLLFIATREVLTV